MADLPQDAEDREELERILDDEPDDGLAHEDEEPWEEEEPPTR
jgi:hypothetical protein